MALHSREDTQQKIEGFFWNLFVHAIGDAHLVLLVHREPGLGMYEPTTLCNDLRLDLGKR